MSIKTNKLVGLGNTCYLNSVIQMIYHIKELRDFILNTNF